jgi:hypothetical protein
MTDTGLIAPRIARAPRGARHSFGVLQKRRPHGCRLDQWPALPRATPVLPGALVSQTLRHMGALDAVLRKFVA